MEKYNRKSIFENLKDFCIFATENDYMEVVEWSNGEGFDVDIKSSRVERFQLTHGEFELLMKMVEELNKE